MTENEDDAATTDRNPGASGRPSPAAQRDRLVQVPPDLQDQRSDERPGRVRHPFERSDVTDAGAPPQGGVPDREDVVPGQGDPSSPTQDAGQGLEGETT
jgi:hypothetical protein